MVEPVKKHLADKGVLALDGVAALHAAPDPTYPENDEHMNGEGHAAVGAALAGFLLGMK